MNAGDVVTAWMTYPRNGKTVRVDLEGERVVFGRASNCGVVLSLKGVSRVHFEAECKAGQWEVADLNSTNGTYVNQKMVTRQQLRDGDRVTLGPPGLVPVVLTYHQPRETSDEDEQRLSDDFWNTSESGKFVPGPSSDLVPDAPVLRGGTTRNQIVVEDGDDSRPSVNAAIDVAEYERHVGNAQPAEPPQGEGGILDSVGRGNSDSGRADAGLIIGLFSRLGNALLKSEDVDEMLDTALRLAFDDLPADRGSVWLVDEENASITARATRTKDGTDAESISISRTIVNEAIRTNRAMLVSNAVEEFAGATSIEQWSIRSAMCAPMYYEGRVRGFIYVDSLSQWVVFNERHLEILTALAIFAAVGVEKWRIQKSAVIEKARRVDAKSRIQALLEVATSLSSELDRDNLVQVIMSRARELMNADRCSVFLVDRDADELWSTLAEGTDNTIRVPMKKGFVGHVARTGETLNIPNAYEDPRFNPEVDKTTGYTTKSILCMPMRNKDKVIIGVTQIINKHSGTFTEEDEGLLEAFCAQAAVALENSMLFQEAIETKNRMESILQSISQLVLTLSEDGKLLQANANVGPLLGITEDRMRKQPYDKWFNGQNDELIESIRRVYEKPESVYVADYDLKAGNRTISYNYTIVPLRDFEGEQDGVVIVLEDISQQKRVMSTLGRYMSPALAQKILDEGGDRLGGVRQEVTVLFSDIRGYTSMTEAMDAAQVVETLNAYFSHMVDTVFAEGGILDKYIGDALMAVFGVPFVKDDDAARACRSALRMRRALDAFNRWQIENGQRPVGIGIGISSGDVITGNIGSERRLEYTCIGDSVNVASRLEGLCKQYNVNIVISESTKEEIGDEFLTRELDTVRVIGKQHPIRIYELLGDEGSDIDARQLRAIPYFHSGLSAYRQGKWTDALRHFQTAGDLANDPPSRLFVDRCRAFLRDGTPDDWCGVWDLSRK